MKPTAVFAAAALFVAFAQPATAETSLTAYNAARQALLAIWAELPLTLRNATLTDGVASGYGDYASRPSNSYGPGEEIDVYVEVLGYGWRDNGDGTLSKLLDADLALVDAGGVTVASQPKFMTSEVKSRSKLLETDLVFNVRLTAFKPGAYKLQFAIHDRAGGKDGSFELPVTLAEAAPTASSVEPAPEASSAQ
ncbi:MAG: hypothetical protein ABI697_10010 [Devosia sp.]